VDIRVIDRFIHFIAAYSVSFAGWLWRIIDNRWLDQAGHIAGQVNVKEKLLQEMESRTIQHQILVLMFWLGAMTCLLYIMIK
jgi:DNA-directed RNA polymerase specialized sigma24 family protein